MSFSVSATTSVSFQDVVTQKYIDSTVANSYISLTSQMVGVQLVPSPQKGYFFIQSSDGTAFWKYDTSNSAVALSLVNPITLVEALGQAYLFRLTPGAAANQFYLNHFMNNLFLYTKANAPSATDLRLMDDGIANNNKVPLRKMSLNVQQTGNSANTASTGAPAWGQGNTVNAAGSGSGGSWWWIILLIFAIIVVAVLVYWFWWRTPVVVPAVAPVAARAEVIDVVTSAPPQPLNSSNVAGSFDIITSSRTPISLILGQEQKNTVLQGGDVSAVALQDFRLPGVMSTSQTLGINDDQPEEAETPAARGADNDTVNITIPVNTGRGAAQDNEPGASQAPPPFYSRR